MDMSRRPGGLNARGGEGFRPRIPSPQQISPELAREQALMSRMTPADIGGMSDDQLNIFSDEYNKPQMNLGDAVFGPDSEPFNFMEFFSKLFGGNR